MRRTNNTGSGDQTPQEQALQFLQDTESTCCLFFGETHNANNARPLLIEMITQRLIDNLFLEIPECSRKLADELASPFLSFDEMSTDSINELYEILSNMFEDNTEIPWVQLIKVAKNNGVAVYLHDLPMEGNMKSYNSKNGLKIRNKYSANIISQFMDSAQNGSRSVVFCGGDHLHSSYALQKLVTFNECQTFCIDFNGDNCKVISKTSQTNSFTLFTPQPEVNVTTESTGGSLLHQIIINAFNQFTEDNNRHPNPDELADVIINKVAEAIKDNQTTPEAIKEMLTAKDDQGLVPVNLILKLVNDFPDELRLHLKSIIEGSYEPRKESSSTSNKY